MRLAVMLVLSIRGFSPGLAGAKATLDVNTARLNVSGESVEVGLLCCVCVCACVRVYVRACACVWQSLS